VTTWTRPLAETVLVIDAGAAPALPQALQARVERLWQKSVHDRPTLFDGRVYSPRQYVTNSAGVIERIEGAFIPYSRYLACRHDADLASKLDLWVLGVTGMLRCPEGVVVGRRASDTTDGGRFELVPSGTLDESGPDNRVDIRRIVLKELREETGLSERDVISPPKSFVLVGDETDRIADVVVTLQTPLRLDAIRSCHASLSAPEHDILDVAGPAASLTSFDRSDLLASSVAVLRHAGVDTAN
jgi:hypothetical protein